MNFSTWTAKLSKLKHMKGQDWLIVILLGVLLLIVAIPSGTLKKSSQSDSRNGDSYSENSDSDKEAGDGSQNREAAQNAQAEYVSSLKKELEAILGKMQGVGQVEVMITLKDDGQAILDKDISSEKESHKENTVIYSNGNDTNPYVTQEKLPQVEGVVVVAEGATSASTVTQITDAVTALFQVETHKVKVIPMKR